MASNVTPFPRLPTPPKNFVSTANATASEVNAQYLTDLVRALEVFIRQVQNPQLNFQEVPLSGNNNILQQGDIYIADGGFLKIIGKTEIFSGSVSATGSIGTVTIAVS